MPRTPAQDIAACRAFALQQRPYAVSRVLDDAADQIERLALADGYRTNLRRRIATAIHETNLLTSYPNALAVADRVLSELGLATAGGGDAQ